MIIAVPFDSGYVLAVESEPGSGLRIKKHPRGLLVSSQGELDEADRAFLVRSDVRGPRAIAEMLVGFVGGELEEAEWVFSWEETAVGSAGSRSAGATGTGASTVARGREGKGPAASSIGAYRVSFGSTGTGHGPPVHLSRLGWGAMVPGPRDDPEVFGQSLVVLQEELSRGVQADVRLAAVIRTFAWAATRVPELGPELDVGLHEAGGRFSVDRVRWALYLPDKE